MATKNNQYGDFLRFFGDIKVPNFDYSALFTIHRRNVEALSAANQVVTEGFQAVSRRQVEIAKSNVEDFLSVARDVWSAPSPEANATKQAELARNLFEKNVNHVRELTELATKSNIEAFDVINKRVVESMEEATKVAKAA